LAVYAANKALIWSRCSATCRRAILAGIHPNSVKHWERCTGIIGGYGVSKMVEALANAGIQLSEEHPAAGRSISVLRA
jgi:hypothetical protein